MLVNLFVVTCFFTCVFLIEKDITREQAEAQQCSANNWQLADNFNPFPATAVEEWSDIVPSSIVTATHRNHTIAFVGTSDGNLVKVMCYRPLCTGNSMN